MTPRDQARKQNEFTCVHRRKIEVTLASLVREKADNGNVGALAREPN